VEKAHAESQELVVASLLSTVSALKLILSPDTPEDLSA
jgi:hypothetical protein